MLTKKTSQWVNILLWGMLSSLIWYNWIRILEVFSYVNKVSGSLILQKDRKNEGNYNIEDMWFVCYLSALVNAYPYNFVFLFVYPMCVRINGSHSFNKYLLMIQHNPNMMLHAVYTMLRKINLVFFWNGRILINQAHGEEKNLETCCVQALCDNSFSQNNDRDNKNQYY